MKTTAIPQNPYTRGNAPRTLKDYLAYPRVLLTLILLLIVAVMHIAFGIYTLFFEK